MAGKQPPGPRVPSVGEDPRDGMEVSEPAGKTWFRDLDEAVVEADRCTQCGTCIAACPSDSLGIDDVEGRPTLVKMCTGCSRCWDFCPRSGLRYERVGRTVAESGSDAVEHYAARAATDGIQNAGENGGAVTALLSALLRAGEIDGAVVAADDGFDGTAALATSPADLERYAGSTYAQTMQLGRVADLVADSNLDDPDLALVGTPCVAEGARALKEYGREDELAHVSFIVSLLCTASFEVDRLRSQVASHGVDPEDVVELSVVGDAVRAFDAAGEELLATDLDGLGSAVLRGCAECADFTGRAADISAGTVGSPRGATTLLTRTDRGERALEIAGDALELERTDASGTESLAEWKRARATDVLPRELDPEGDLSISYERHREAYDDTERGPEPLNRARVYQYEEWC